MTRLSVLAPLDQPLGKRRLLAELKDGFGSAHFHRLRICVAFANSGPLLRLGAEIAAWRAEGKDIEAIFGIDLAGTSKQALELAMASFTSVFVTQHRGVTFHPKIYLFEGETRARCFIGSHNLTVGGTETNFEAGLRLDLRLPNDSEFLSDIVKSWDDLLPPSCPATTRLTPAELAQLVADEIVFDEKVRNGAEWLTSRGGPSTRKLARRSALKTKPPSALPSGVHGGAKPPRSGGPVVVPPPPRNRVVPRGFALQIKPHANGEIFLSRIAASQDPDFFGMPFTGKTIPKKTGNAAYPQRSPDPKVNIIVLGVHGTSILTLTNYSLNTVFYEAKAEIRITASQLVGIVPDYSVMVMEPGEDDVDYEITIFVPGHPEYSDWLAACNQLMPGGGSKPRRFGWF